MLKLNVFMCDLCITSLQIGFLTNFACICTCTYCREGMFDSFLNSNCLNLHTITVRTAKGAPIRHVNPKLVKIRLKIDKHNPQTVRNSLKSLIYSLIMRKLSVKNLNLSTYKAFLFISKCKSVDKQFTHLKCRIIDR